MKNKIVRAGLWSLVFSLFSVPAFALYDSGKGGAVKETGSLTTMTTEQKVVVYKLSGTATIVKSGSPKEKELKIGDEIEAGDHVFTEKGASLSISFDERRLNTVSIPSGSEAVFTSLSPVSIRLKNGSVFSSVDGLAEGSTWEISTPAAVAAVRGTQFEVEYSESSGEFSAMTYDDDNEKKASAIELTPAAGGAPVKIAEGRQISFARGQVPTQNLIQKMSPDIIQRGKKFKEDVREDRRRFAEQKRKADQNNGPQNPGGPGNTGGQNRPDGGVNNPNGSAHPFDPHGFQPGEKMNQPNSISQNAGDLPPQNVNGNLDGRSMGINNQFKQGMPGLSGDKPINPSSIGSVNAPQGSAPARKPAAGPLPPRRK